LIGDPKNLAAAEPRTYGNAAGDTAQTPDEARGRLIDYAWWMKKQGYAESTIASRIKLLRILVGRGADLNFPESIKEALARQKWVEKRKINAADAYTCFLRMHSLSWEPPRYKVIQQLPFVPTEKEIDQLIASSSRRLVPLLQLLKETGVRIGEAVRLRWTDVDFENKTVRVTPEKGSNARVLPISNSLKAMLTELQAASMSDKLFPSTVRDLRRAYQRQRKRIAAKLRNPRIDKITFHTFRHFKGTMEYHKTKDILHVMQVLGHRNIKNTLIYVQLVDFKEDEYVSKAATTVEEACRLVDAGFEHVCEMNGVQIFRKRK
jgi:integrase